MSRPPLRDRYDGERRGFARWIVGFFSGLVTMAVLALALLLISVFIYESPGPAAAHPPLTNVVLRKHAGVSEMSMTLERAGVVRSHDLFIAAAELTGAARRLKAGEYDFPSHASLAQVLFKIRNGDIEHHRITIPEGLTSQQAVDILNASDVLVGQVPTPPEGVLMPDTYDVTRGEQRSAVLQKMMDERDRLLGELWAHHRAGLPFTTVDDAVTLASIVEKETALPGERPRVAAVYINRLRQGMKLQADPTVIYGVSGGAPLGHGLRESELLTASPYNTYLNIGLPPGPIDNPGRASLAAVMDPPQTDELYFVADGTGGHVFSRTNEEQAANVAKWRKIEQDRQAGLPAAPPAAAAGPPPVFEHR